MKPRTRRALLAALTVLALAATSCAAGSGQPAPPPLGPVAVVRGAADLVLPLDSYSYTNKEYADMARAQARLTADCMRRFGVDYSTDPGSLVPGVTMPDFDHLNERRYGLLDPASAAVRGYRSPRDPGATDPVPAKQAGSAPSPETLLLLDGRTRPEFAHATLPTDTDGKALPADGCTGEAGRTLSGGVPGDLTFANSLAVQAYHHAESDARLRPAMQAWSRCMSAHGYDYTDLWQPNNKSWPNPVGSEEIATASADVACKLQTNVAGVWFALETAYQRQAIEAHAQQLAQVRRYLDNLERNSARTMGG